MILDMLRLIGTFLKDNDREITPRFRNGRKGNLFTAKGYSSKKKHLLSISKESRKRNR